MSTALLLSRNIFQQISRRQILLELQNQIFQKCRVFYILDVGCVLRDGDYESHALIDKKMANQQECQRWCQETQKCEMFVYAMDVDINRYAQYIYKYIINRNAQSHGLKDKSKLSNCFLKKNISNVLSKKKGLAAGQKFCPMYGKILSLFSN